MARGTAYRLFAYALFAQLTLGACSRQSPSQNEVTSRGPAPMAVGSPHTPVASSDRTDVVAIGSRKDAVFDRAGVLSTAFHERLAQQLHAFEQKTGHGLIVITTPSLDGQDIASVTTSLLQRFTAAANGRSDVMIVLIAPRDRRARIAVGKALTDTVTNAFCEQVLQQDMLPAFKAGHLEMGIDAGVSRLLGQAAGRPAKA